MNFHYDKNRLTTVDELLVSVADLRDVVQAFSIQNEGQRQQEIQFILEAILRKNKLPRGSLSVRISANVITHSDGS